MSRDSTRSTSFVDARALARGSTRLDSTRLDSTRLDSFAVDMARSSRAFDGARDARFGARRRSRPAAGTRETVAARAVRTSARRAVVEALDAHHALSAQAGVGDGRRRAGVRRRRLVAGAAGAGAAAYEALAHVGRSCSARRSWRGLVGWR